MDDRGKTRTALAPVDASLERPGSRPAPTPQRITLILADPGPMFRLGLRVFNALNQFNPRDVQNNLASPAFGGFYNPIPRSFGLTFWIDR